MLSELMIPKKTSVEAALDRQQLYAVGLQHVQERSKRIWTDYNVHDPGITTIELLCYALTDLGYRASIPMQDLLASATGDTEQMRKQFFTAREILPSKPLTMVDYRKLLIDLKGIKNAWVRPAEQKYYADLVTGELLPADPGLPGIKEVILKGLYDVIIEYRDDMITEEKEKVRKSVQNTLMANRNLCEDFVTISEVGTQSYLLCCEIELAAHADAAVVKAEILFQVQQYFSPTVMNYTLREMLKRTKSDGTPYAADEIFRGPLLTCGFIDDEELEAADLRSKIRLSDIINIIMDIDGVQAVREIVINQAPETADAVPTPPENRWELTVPAAKKAVLDRERSRMVFYKRNMPVEPDHARVADHLQKVTAELATKTETEAVDDFEVPRGTYRNTEAYYSFQNHFPALYGLSETGLKVTADMRRKNLSRQLKAYLLFFDQVMANYFAQLGKVRELFSSDPAVRQTYFYQAVDSFRDFEKIYNCTISPEAMPIDGKGKNELICQKIVETLQNDIEDNHKSIERRNRFLDHLIARFAERFTDFVNIMYSAFGFAPDNLIDYKCEFLNSYPVISRERSLAYDYSLKNDTALWNTENVSGLEKRLARLLGLLNHRRRNLSDIAYDVYAEVDETPSNEFRFRIRKKDTGKIVLSSSTKYTTKDLARKEMRRAIHFGMIPSGFQRKTTTEGKHYFNIVDSSNEVIARRIEYFETAAEMNAEIEELMHYLRTNYSDEGMYLIENILLRPEAGDDPVLPICPSSETAGEADPDPYSYRLQIILPAYGTRFHNLEFRRFAEDVIREEVPAHILPKICWTNTDDMAMLERRYQDWISLKAGATTADRKAKLSAFIEALFAVKNVYESRKLHACGGEMQDKFILGATSLGTMPEDNS